MTRTAIRHTLSALAAAALFSAFANSPVSAQGKLVGQGIGNYATNDNQDAASKKDPKKTPKGLATKKRLQPLQPTDVPAINYTNPEVTDPR